jgi:multidrug efflux system membrane fusion protein
MTQSRPGWPERINRTTVTIASVGGVVLLFAIHAASAVDKGKAPKAPVAIPVAAGKPVVQDLPIWLSGVGTVSPLNLVDVKARVDGQLIRLDFREGQDVQVGQVLAQLDPRPYQALVDQAAANKARDQAQLANARLDLARAIKLAAIGAGTGQNADTLKAQVATLAATVAGDQAQLESARLNLGFTTIRSPITGRAGLRQIDPGAMIHASDATGIVTVTQVQPIAVLFSLPQDALPALRQAARDAPVAALDRSSDSEIAHGSLSVVDSQVDPTNGQVKLKAVFANADHALWPGSLIAARIRASVQLGAMVVPATAIQTSQDGNFVYVVGADRKVALRPVRTGATVNGVTAISAGLALDDMVVFTGQSRLEKGSSVAIRSLAWGRNP